MLRAAVAKTKPEQISLLAGPRGEDEEIFVFGDYDAIFSKGICPNLAVIGLTLAAIQNVDSIMSLGAQPACEGGRQLVVHEEFHAAMASTVWSV